MLQCSALDCYSIPFQNDILEWNLTSFHHRMWHYSVPDAHWLTWMGEGPWPAHCLLWSRRYLKRTHRYVRAKDLPVPVEWRGLRAPGIGSKRRWHVWFVCSRDRARARGGQQRDTPPPPPPPAPCQKQRRMKHSDPQVNTLQDLHSKTAQNKPFSHSPPDSGSASAHVPGGGWVWRWKACAAVNCSLFGLDSFCVACFFFSVLF